MVKALVGIGREHLASHLAVKYGMLDSCFNFFCTLENVEHFGGGPEQAATMATCIWID